ncbi:MAG TPA: metallophosphoesterase [Candidatus Brocadiia bacterium]|nr:metallophosphoesterase [Candidatus Brocadiia bacterium]
MNHNMPKRTARAFTNALAVVSLCLVGAVAAGDVPPPRIHDALLSKPMPQPGIKIVYPAIGNPALVGPSRRFRMLLRANIAQSADLKVSLEPGWPTGEARVRNLCFSGKDKLIEAEVELPEKTPLRRPLDLVVRCGDLAARAPNAVFMTGKAPDDFDVVQITDLELRGAPLEPSRNLERAIAEINCIAPAFVIATGDLTYAGNPEEYKELVRVLSLFRVPVFAVIGNADYHGDQDAFFETINPYHDFTVDYGPCRFVGLDTGTNHIANPQGGYNPATDQRGTGLSDAQTAWLAGALASAGESLKIVFMHFPAVSQFNNGASIAFNREKFKELCAEHNVALVVAGHTHLDAAMGNDERPLSTANRKPAGTIHVQTATTSSETRAIHKAYSYRLIRIAAKEVACFSMRLDKAEDTVLSESIPAGKIKIASVIETLGEHKSRVVQTRNELNEEFPAAQVSVAIPKREFSGGSPAVRGGKLIDSYDRGEDRVFVIEFRLPARSRAQVSLTMKSPGQ